APLSEHGARLCATSCRSRVDGTALRGGECPRSERSRRRTSERVRWSPTPARARSRDHLICREILGRIIEKRRAEGEGEISKTERLVERSKLCDRRTAEKYGPGHARTFSARRVHFSEETPASVTCSDHHARPFRRNTCTKWSWKCGLPFDE